MSSIDGLIKLVPGAAVGRVSGTCNVIVKNGVQEIACDNPNCDGNIVNGKLVCSKPDAK